jgi:hypothetical protein
MTIGSFGPTQLNQPTGYANHAKDMRFAAAFQQRDAERGDLIRLRLKTRNDTQKPIALWAFDALFSE